MYMCVRAYVLKREDRRCLRTIVHRRARIIRDMRFLIRRHARTNHLFKAVITKDFYFDVINFISI